MHLYRSVTVDMARDAYFASVVDQKRDLTSDRDSLMAALKRARNAYAGGLKATTELIRRYNETPAEWRNRHNHYRNVPVTKEAVHKIAWLLYGTPPSIEIWEGERPPGIVGKALGGGSEPSKATTGLSDFVNMTLEENRNNHMMLRAARQRILDGRAVVKIWGVDQYGVSSLPFDTLRMDVHKTEDAWPIYDPDDPDIMLAMAEWRGGEWFLWTAESVDMVGPDLSIKGSMGAHPLPGVIPFAVLGDNCPLLDDVVEYQKELINRASTWHAVERACAYPVGVFSGLPGNQEKIPTGAEGLPGQPKAIDVGGGLRYVYFQEPSGGFAWVKPDTDTAVMRENYQAVLKEALELGAGLPAESGGLDGAQPEQPTTIILRWLRAFINRDQLILEAKAFEDCRLWIMTKYAELYGADLDVPAFNADEADWEVTFPDNPFAQDQRLEREAARAEVLADLRPASMYVKEHVVPEADADELQMVLDALEAQKQAKVDAFLGAEGENEGRPEPEDE